MYVMSITHHYANDILQRQMYKFPENSMGTCLTLWPNSLPPTKIPNIISQCPSPENVLIDFYKKEWKIADFVRQRPHAGADAPTQTESLFVTGNLEAF